MPPMISINISCLNRARMLRECIDSFLEQTLSNFEIIVVDDGSTEDISFVSDMDDRVKFYRQKHGGMAKGLNLAMEKSSGQYIMPFGSDDLVLPNLLLETFEVLYNNPEYDVVYTDYWVRNREGGEIRKKHIEITDTKKAYEMMLEQQYIPHGGTLWKKEMCPKYDETVWSAEDWELMLTAMESGVRFKHLPKRLWVYRTGHSREGDTQWQVDGCNKVLGRRGFRFDEKTRRGIKL